MEHTVVETENVTSQPGVKTQNWYAWLNTMPPGPHVLHVKGEVQVLNTNMHARLVKKEPQGINPAILLLDLILIQKPGRAGQIVHWVQVSYEEVARKHTVTEVNVFSGTEIIAKIPVEIIT